MPARNIPWLLGLLLTTALAAPASAAPDPEAAPALPPGLERWMRRPAPLDPQATPAAAPDFRTPDQLVADGAADLAEVAGTLRATRTRLLGIMRFETGRRDEVLDGLGTIVRRLGELERILQEETRRRAGEKPRALGPR